MRGIFVGAKVGRGHDWEWNEQDGGKGIFISMLRVHKFNVFICSLKRKLQFVNTSKLIHIFQ